MMRVHLKLLKTKGEDIKSETVKVKASTSQEVSKIDTSTQFEDRATIRNQNGIHGIRSKIEHGD